MTTGHSWLPPDPTEGELDALHLGPEGYMRIIGPHLAGEVSAGGGRLPPVARIAAVITAAIEEDCWLQELGENTIEPEQALVLSRATSLGVRRALEESDREGTEG